MSRWKMHKLGFVNFWLYDTEEFPLENGHILLRGNNGSGKSITTQSFIPFILDGNKSPERLDPFGSRDRKMEYYLLGENEREESTGYLYLEFKKADADMYLTIGVGMRAQRGKQMDFWGFCLNDGRRVGDGFRLFERAGRVLLPLSKQKLKNLLNSDENWAESPGKYKELVNARVFQFGDIRHYEQLISLLIKVRAPKLSKDAFRPSEVKKILNDSLQVLSDEDLSAMVSTMERMDELEDRLRDLQTAKKDVQTIRNEYTRYNQYMLGQKGNAYIKAHQGAVQLKTRLEEAKEARESIAQQLHREEGAREAFDLALSRADTERRALGEDDLSSKRRQLEEARSRCKTYQDELLFDGTHLQETEKDIDRQEVKLREKRQEVTDSEAELQAGARHLTAINGILELGDAHDSYVRGLSAGRGHSLVKAAQEALKRRKSQIEQMLKSLKDAERLRAEFDEACQLLDAALTAEAEANVRLKDAQQLEREERDRLLESFSIRAAQNELLRLDASDMAAVKRIISRYRSGADWSDIRDILDRCFNRDYKNHAENRLRTAHLLETLRAEAADLNRSLNDVRRQPDPAPPRREQIERTRVQLAMQGIPCVPFYEAVDFAPELAQPERDLLEAQLRDAGLLDALLVSEEHLDQMRDILREYPDCFLLPNPPVPEPVAGLVPEAGRYSALARDCLRGISCADLDAETALLPDGRFRNGIVRGHSRAEQPAGYVGAAARRANRERQIQALERRIAELAAKISGTETDLVRIDGDLERLQAERDAMPTSADLDQALESLASEKLAVESAASEREQRQKKEREAKAAHARAEQVCRDLSLGLPYARTSAAYEEAEAAASEYQDTLLSLDGAHARLSYLLQGASELEEGIEKQRNNADKIRQRIRKERAMLDREQVNIESFEKYLNLPENRERAQRIEALDREIAELREKLRGAGERCVSLQKDLESVAGRIQSTNEDYLKAVLKEDDLEKYFREDLALELVDIPAEGSLLQIAREASGRIQASDRERTVAEIENSLRRNYQEHNNSLLPYQPRIEPVFDAPAESSMLRQRLCITFQKEGKELSLPAFARELQSDIETTELVLEDKDRDLFENILTETISHKLRLRVEESQKWTRDMTALMQTLNTSMGLTFSLDWKARQAEESGELDTAQLVQLLSKDRALLTREDSQRVSTHFRAKVKKARDSASANERPMNYGDLIREVLDYRTWYEFHLSYRRGAEARKELTDRVFNRFSGGEKAMAMYVPLFAAVSAQYMKGGDACPRLLALDEAFAGVDDRNIGAMFELVGHLDFDYIMNSQVLWGCYPNVEDLDIAELYHSVNTGTVAILHYHWNGTRRLPAGERS